MRSLGSRGRTWHLCESMRAVLINGEVVTPENATISVFYRGFLYGDSVFETIRTYGGRPFALESICNGSRGRPSGCSFRSRSGSRFSQTRCSGGRGWLPTPRVTSA